MTHSAGMYPQIRIVELPPPPAIASVRVLPHGNRMYFCVEAPRATEMSLSVDFADRSCP